MPRCSIVRMVPINALGTLVSDLQFCCSLDKYVLYKGGTHGSKLLTKNVSQF